MAAVVKETAHQASLETAGKCSLRELGEHV